MKDIMKARCLVLGASYVGKTALIKTMVQGASTYMKNYNMVRIDYIYIINISISSKGS